MLLLIRTELMQQRILFSLNVTEGLPPILADKIQIQQVLMNLILNAVDAIDAANTEQRALSVTVDRDKTVISALRSAIRASGSNRKKANDCSIPFSPPNRPAWAWA